MNARSLEILLIEDDADDAELTIYSLRKCNLANKIIHIDDGERALEFLYQPLIPPMLILLDLKLPRVDGIQILRKLKSDPERQEIPVVALLSSKEGVHYLESFDLRADGYMVKPVDYKQFYDVVARMGITSMIMTSPAQNI